MPKKASPIRSLSRGIAVLQAINRSGSLTLSEIARTCDLPVPTVTRLLHTLMHEGLIEREPSRRRYRPTVMVKTLSHGFQGDAWLVMVARPHIVNLTRMVGWPITLSTHVGHSMVIRDSTHALSALTFNEYFPGYASPLLETAAGVAFICSIGDEERLNLLRAMEEFGNPAWEHMIEAMRDEARIGAIRELGYAVSSYNQFTLNPGKTSSIASPVHDGDVTVGTISLAFFVSALTMEDAVQRFSGPIRDCADAIGRDLRAREAQPDED